MLIFDSVVPVNQDIDAMAQRSGLNPFAPQSLAFIAELSRTILRSPAFREHPEMIAFAYWMREARLKQLHKDFKGKSSGGLLAPRGLVFHIAPSNVDTIFLYSILLSMLVGNKNIVRVSSRESGQVGAILELFNTLFKNQEYKDVRDRLAIVRYGHDDKVTHYFSSLCDMRVIWGGNATVNTIRAIPISPRATEICFADKVSLAVFDAKSYRSLEDKAAFVKNFINDSFWFGQMACSSPRLVIWRGTKTDAKSAQHDFWHKVEAALITDVPELSEMDYLNKLVFEQGSALKGNLSIMESATNHVSVLEVSGLEDMPIEDHCGGGMFLQTRITALEDLSKHLSKRFQTIVSHGISGQEWTDFLTQHRPEGIDRIVPVGEALTFSPIWDGFDILREFSREISVDV